MISYLAATVSFLAALIALAGDTWNKSSPGRLKFTKTGKIAATLAVLGLVVSLFMVHASDRSSRKTSAQLERAASSAEHTRDKIESLEAENRDYKALLNIMLDESERQPQYVMAEYVSLDRGEIWRAPNVLYPGSLVRFYGFSCALLLSYEGKQERIRPPEHSSVPEIAVVGGSGEAMTWDVRSVSGQPCDGKIYIVSTPRIRSAIRSWSEETRDRKGREQASNPGVAPDD